MRRAVPRLKPALAPRLARPHPRALCVARFSTSPARQADEKLPLQERLRRKIWGTDTPPGAPPEFAGKPAEEPEAEKGKEGTGKDLVEAGMTNYVEETDGRSLPIVGLDSLGGVWEINSFFPIEPLKAPESVQRALHRAVVEVFTQSLNSRSPLQVIETGYTGPEHATDKVSINVSESGETRFDYSSPEVEAAILQSAQANEETEVRRYSEEEVYAPLEKRPAWLEESLQGDCFWMEVPLPNNEVKFALVKRILQLSGIRIPDSAVSQATIVFDLYQHMIAKPKPKKLAVELAESELVQLPNVKVFDSRIRPLDKERAIGRGARLEQALDYKYVGIDKPRKVWNGHVTWDS